MANDNQLKLISTVFSHNGHIPPQYTCEGKNINPPLKIENIPDKKNYRIFKMHAEKGEGGYPLYWQTVIIMGDYEHNIYIEL